MKKNENQYIKEYFNTDYSIIKHGDKYVNYTTYLPMTKITAQANADSPEELYAWRVETIEDVAFQRAYIEYEFEPEIGMEKAKEIAKAISGMVKKFSDYPCEKLKKDAAQQESFYIEKLEKDGVYVSFYEKDGMVKRTKLMDHPESWGANLIVDVFGKANDEDAVNNYKQLYNKIQEVLNENIH